MNPSSHPLLALCLSAMIPSVFADSPKPLPEPTKSDVVYGTEDRQVLDFWQADTETPAPVVVYLHGGAWSKGDKSDIRKRNFAPCLDAGISLVSINYRFVRQAQAADVKPPVEWPMHDAARAVQFVRSKSAEWNLDAGRVAMSGTSAGACTSLWLAFHDDLADPDSEDPVARQSTRLDCAAVYGAQTSLDPLQLREWTPNSNYGGHAFGFRGERPKQFEAFIAGREEVLPWIREYSPIEHADAGDPPVFLLYDRAPGLGKPQKDPTHSANLGAGLRLKLDDLGVPCELAYPRSEEAEHASMEAYLIDRLGSASPAVGAADEAKDLRVYLLMGQSNMAGRDRRFLDEQVDDPGVLAMDRKGKWSVARDPIHAKRGRTEPGEGPGIAFGRAMAEAEPGTTIGLIPCAIGGSSLDSWLKGGEFYEETLRKARLAAGRGSIAGILWHQGETDAANRRRAERYEERLRGMLGDLRADLGDPRLPVVIGEIGQFLDRRKQPFAEQVREAARKVADGDPTIGFVDSSELGHKGDALHFSAEASHELGRRFAKEMRSLVPATETAETSR